MKSVVRSTMVLVCSVAALLVVLAALLWSWHLTTNHFATFSSNFLFPARTHLAEAQRSLARVQSTLHTATTTPTRPAIIPPHLKMRVELDNVEGRLMHLVRLVQTVDYQHAFGLPTRALEQFEGARANLAALDRMTAGDKVQALARFEPVQHTLEQLEHILELEARDQNEARRSATTSALIMILLTVALLVITAIPFIARLSRDLRDSIERELRARRDLEEAKQSLEVLAMYDSLTELGNRNLFRVRLEHVIQSTKRSKGTSGLLYIDLDNFKRINDSLGHDAGDEVLKAVAARLQGCVREADTVARLGGDEFTVILADVDSSTSIASIAKKLLRHIQAPMTVTGTEVVVSASIGITIIPNDGDDPALLMKNADMALYKAKDQGRNNFQFFVEKMHRAMLGKMAMENDLRGALKGDEFTLHYQPQLDLASGQVACLEALLRWPRPDGGMVAPDTFIEVADEAGLLTEIGGWVLMQACSDLARARRDAGQALRMSVNLSANQFRDPALERRIERALRASGLAPEALEVEITETTLIQDIEAAAKTLGALRDLGISVAIDDFGIGYSSLSYLKHLPIDALKIDRSFVRDIRNDEADRSIVDAILAMARSLSLRVVAEGIEDEWQLRYLAANGCDMGQGYLFATPQPFAQLSIDRLNRRWSAQGSTPERTGLPAVGTEAG